MSRDFIAGIILLVGSLGYYAAATRIPISLIDTSVSSSALPRALGIGGAILSSMLIVSSLLERRGRTTSTAGTSVPADARGWLPHRRAAGVLGIVVMYVILLNIVGYIVAMALTIAVMAHYQGTFYGNATTLPVTILVAAIGALSFWVIFVKLLGVPMPQGVWRHVL